MCRAFTTISWQALSNMLKTGFQYTPVDSMAACVTPHSPNQSRRLRNSAVVVPNSRICLFGSAPAPGVSTHAAIVSLWTSKPAQRA
jgi:hypothetical protein